jgi:hypothetical protein
MNPGLTCLDTGQKPQTAVWRLHINNQGQIKDYWMEGFLLRPQIYTPLIAFVYSSGGSSKLPSSAPKITSLMGFIARNIS